MVAWPGEIVNSLRSVVLGSVVSIGLACLMAAADCAAAQDAGARLYEGSRVTAIERGEPRLR